MTEISPDEGSSKRTDFICGVVEGFYGRPWTTEQRKDLFQKLKKWGLDMYVYAPKDDYKHRAYWRELYTVEEAEHLTSLITAAKEQGITFCYALSPGLDITYSSQKEVTILKRKLEQVSQFGCTCFALLFDDIELEMSEADKQIFQSFAHAQVSVTNELHQHLCSPRFLLCPTQYCSSRAVPSVANSEYLNTLGSKLDTRIDIMWTGPKVISKVLTRECIEEITQVLRRPPVIWDNLHANDYDQKRIFLGPYCGRSPELIPYLRGVLTNPNCEYNANLVAIRTLAHWATCTLDAPTHVDAVSWDIKLEREGEQGVSEDEPPLSMNRNVYHPRQALRMAINEWLPEFSIPKTAQGPVIKPQPPIVPPVPIIPILPSVNTCMSLITSTSNTSTTTTSDISAAIPTLNASQLQALADVCCANSDGPIVSSTESINPVSNPIMNSLVSESKVVVNECIQNPIVGMAATQLSASLPASIPVSTLPVPLLGIRGQPPPVSHDESLSNDSVIESPSFMEEMSKDAKMADDNEQIVVDDDAKVTASNGDMSVGETPVQSPLAAAGGPSAGDGDVLMNDAASESGSMQVEPSHSPLSADMMVEPQDNNDASEQLCEDPPAEESGLTTEDLVLLCDLFYLPFEHGARGLRLLRDFHWLTQRPHTNKGNTPELCEWRRRRARWAWWAARARRLLRRLGHARNRELHAELQPYLWELCAVLALLDGYVRWLELGKVPANVTAHTQAGYTWFSKGWREAFESGAQEPWVFRGGLTAELRRLLPVESVGEVCAPAPAPEPAPPARVRPAAPSDEPAIYEICHKTCRDGSDCSELFPTDLQTLPADRLVAPFLTLTPELCMVLENDTESCEPDLDQDEEPDIRKNRSNGVKPEMIGYVCAALNSKEFYKRQEMAWIPEMCLKYPESLLERDDLSPAAKECIRHFHNFSCSERAPEEVTLGHPALLASGVRAGAARGAGRLVATAHAALAALGATGVHVVINSTDHYLHQFYTKLGFNVLCESAGRVYLGRKL